MTRQETIAFFAHRDELWRRRDAAALAAGHTERGIVISPMFATVQGRAAVETSYRNLFAAFAEFEFETLEVIVDADRVAQVFKVRATHTKEFFGVPGTGRRFETQGVLVFKLEGDQIAHERRIYDFTALLIQIGVLKAKPT
jgi:steroid delta-isomerase-like uncharacterized protein